MAVIPSFAGDGIAIALHSAFLGARHHLAGQGADIFHRQAAHAFSRPLRTSRLAAGLISSAAGRKASFALSRLAPGLMSKAIQRTRLAKADILAFSVVPGLTLWQAKPDPLIKPPCPYRIQSGGL
jgi:menaquinone-9 beta-reductase